MVCRVVFTCVSKLFPFCFLVKKKWWDFAHFEEVHCRVMVRAFLTLLSPFNRMHAGHPTNQDSASLLAGQSEGFTPSLMSWLFYSGSMCTIILMKRITSSGTTSLYTRPFPPAGPLIFHSVNEQCLENPLRPQCIPVEKRDSSLLLSL